MSYIQIEKIERTISITEIKVDKISFFLDSENLAIDISYTDVNGYIWKKTLYLEGVDFKNSINIANIENFIQNKLLLTFKKKAK